MNISSQTIRHYQQSVPCNLCHADTYTIRYQASFRPDDSAEDVLQKFRSQGGDILLDQVVQCNKCGLIYINPRLRDDCILKDYTEATIHGYKEQFVSQNKGRSIACARSMRFINKLHPVRGKLLDVGAAAGTFMAIAQNHGWDVYGCEPNRWFCEWGKETYGLDIDQGTLLDQRYPYETFDVVTLWDVIEHVPDPTGIIKKCFSLLKPGGMLILTYPDIGSWIARLMGRRWVFLMSVHLYYFNRKTIARLLQPAGFSIIKSFPHVQTLQLSYIIYRMQVHSAILYRIGKAFSDALHLNNLLVPYWIGVNCIAAKKQLSEP